MSDVDESNISDRNMEILADHIKGYLDLLLEVFIIPDNIMNKKSSIYDAIGVVKDLIRELNKHNRSVFKDKDDWVYLK